MVVKKILKTLTNNFGFKLLAVLLAFTMWLVVYNIDDPMKTQTFTIRVNVLNEETVTAQNKCYQVLDGTNNVSFSVSAPRSTIEKLEAADFNATADMNQMVVDETGTVATVPIDISAERYESSLQYNGGSKFLRIALEDLMSKAFVVNANAKGEVPSGYALGEVAVESPTYVRVEGPASIVSQIAEVVATIDVDSMTMNISDNVVPVLYDAEGNEIDTTRLSISNTTVTITAKIMATKEVDLKFSTSGTLAPNWFVVGITSNPSRIRLKGVSSVLNRITTLEIPETALDMTGVDFNVHTSVDITEYLPDGVELVDYTQRTVDVTVEVEQYQIRNYTLETKNIEVVGLTEEYQLSWLRNNISVSIGGLTSDLDKLSNATLLGTVDVSGLTEGSHTMTIQLALDESVYTVNTAQGSLMISNKADQNENAGTTEGTSQGTEGSTENPGEETTPGNGETGDDSTQGDNSDPSGEPEETAQPFPLLNSSIGNENLRYEME